MRIAVIGTGYVGLVSGVCFSDFGHDVVCVDRDAAKIDRLRAGEIPIYEPGLDALLARNTEAGRLSFTTDLDAALAGAQAVFIAVGTPTRRGDGHADLTYVMEAAEEVAQKVARLRGHRHQVDGARGHQCPRPRRGGRRQSRSGFRRGLEPRIPARGCGDRRFHAPRPRHRRRRDRARRRHHVRDLSPAFPARIPDHGDRSGKRRDDQIRGQCVSGHQDHLHQRDRRALRTGGGGHQAGQPRHGAGRAHRQQVPACGPGLWRLVLPEGYPRAGADRPGTCSTHAHHRDGDRGERGHQAADGGQAARSVRAAASTARRSRCWASRSSPIPTTCATRRR